MELITNFPLRPITNEAELIATQNQINYILDKGQLNRDDRDYIKVLAILVYSYEEKHEPIPALKGVELLQALLEELNLEPKDMVDIFGNEPAVCEILEKKRQITEEEEQKLTDRFL
ncbi:MAG: transcriptional regulator [Prochloraceae cyanobacterium]|nr:transcriptional regulator [Prochloraceae cyanobacterium]